MAEKIVAGGKRTASGPNAPQIGSLYWENTYEKRLKQQKDEPLALSLSAAFELLKEDGVTTAREKMEALQY